nr:MAG TPA: hypothetical protein [Bacteriophage sp.]
MVEGKQSVLFLLKKFYRSWFLFGFYCVCKY